jgi:DNA-3-methyladenine glycosylase I
MKRCPWCEGDEMYTRYHDEEWGTPVHDDRTLFEFLVLGSAQAGLSWITILKKRQSYRMAYDDFNPKLVALYGEEKIQELMANPGIVRNSRKITASINNAKRFLQVQKEFGSFASYIWSFTGNKQLINHWDTVEQVPCFSDLSDKISSDLKNRGFTFLGTKIIYSYLQTVGIIDDHIEECFRRNS